MDWFRRARGGDAAPADTAPELAPPDHTAGDSPGELRRALGDLVRFINRNAGRLPAEAVVEARQITDTLGAIIDTSDVRPLDIYAVVAVRSTLDDYLPTTLRSYLAVDANLIDVRRPSGSTPAESLLEQLGTLHTSASAVLTAAAQQDADALMTQGNFLRTKFSGSDLDL